MKYFLFFNNEIIKSINLNDFKEIKLSSSFENYFDIKKSIFFNELKHIYSEDILFELDNFYETLNSASDKDLRKLKNYKSEKEIDKFIGDISEYLIRFKNSKIVFLLNTKEN